MNRAFPFFGVRKKCCFYLGYVWCTLHLVRDPLGDGYHLLAAGDDFGKVKLYRYPSMVEPSQYLECKGHSSHVTKVKFGPIPNNKQAQYLISTGGNDTAVI